MERKEDEELGRSLRSGEEEEEGERGEEIEEGEKKKTEEESQ